MMDHKDKQKKEGWGGGRDWEEGARVAYSVAELV